MACDLELEITAGAAPGTYAVSVDSPAGTATGSIQLDTAALLGRRREMAASVLASALTTRSGLSVLEGPVREVGTALFDAVFVERVYGRYTASLQEAGRRGEPLRVVLRLRAPELAGLPWETLYDTEAGEYLCQREPVVRYVETAHADVPLTVDPPLRILGMVAAPRDLARLNVPEEQRRLTDAITALAQRGRVELVWVPAGNWGALQQILQEGPWHILHFIGHGGMDPDRGGLLALEDEITGATSTVSAGRFARLLHACRPVPRLVVLNACQSGEAAADDLLSSTAAALVHSGISAAVAMQFAVTDPAALAFSRGFYRAIAHGTPVDEAVRQGRIAIDGTSEHTLEWVTPVLYLRTNDTRLFRLSVTPPPERPDPPIDPKPVSHNTPEPPRVDQTAREQALSDLYQQAVQCARSDRHAEAITLFTRLLSEQPGYRDAEARRDASRRTLRLVGSYRRGRDAEAAGDWTVAIRAYQEVAAIDPGYLDTTARLERCSRARHVTGLQAELRREASAQQWERVLAIDAALVALDPALADLDHLATTAHQQLARRRWEEDQRRRPGITPPLPPAHRAPVTRTSRPGGRRKRLWIILAAVAMFAAVAVVVVVTIEQPIPSSIPQSAALPDDTLIVARTVGHVADLYPVDSATGQIGAPLNLRTVPADHPAQFYSPWPVISPDRKSIIYIMNYDDSVSSMRVVAADGSGDRDLFTTQTDCHRYLPPAWNPVKQDQLGLVCLAGDPLHFVMRIVTLDGTLVHEFPINNAWTDDVSFSPDGTTLAYFSGQPGDQAGSIFTVPTDGSAEPVNLTNATTDRKPMWSPNGKEIVFTRLEPDGGNSAIVVMSADGSNQHAITDGSAKDTDPSWSPDGETIAFRSNRGQDDPQVNAYFLVDSDGSNLRRLSPDDQAPAVTEPAWGRR